MTTTTTLGTWTSLVAHYSASVESTVTDYLNGGDADWRERVEETGAFERMVADYRQAINDALPHGVALAGDEFYGPYYEADRDFQGYPTDDDGRLDIAAIVEDIDLGEIVDRHDPDNA